MTASAPMRSMMHELLRRWSSSGLKIREGATERAIRKFEDRYHVQLPEDLRTFYSIVDGMEENDMDPVEQMRFWPLSEVISVDEEFSGDETVAGCPGFYIFADYSLWAHGYAIDLRPGDPGTRGIILVGGDDPIAIASSFTDFIRKYLHDPQSLFAG